MPPNMHTMRHSPPLYIISLREIAHRVNDYRNRSARDYQQKKLFLLLSILIYACLSASSSRDTRRRKGEGRFKNNSFSRRKPLDRKQCYTLAARTQQYNHRVEFLNVGARWLASCPILAHSKNDTRVECPSRVFFFSLSKVFIVRY